MKYLLSKSLQLQQISKKDADVVKAGFDGSDPNISGTTGRISCS